MANKTLQFLRNTTTVYADYEAALAGLKAKLANTSAGAIADGSPILARYSETVGGVTKERTLLGIKSASGYEIFDNKAANDAIDALDFAWGDGEYVEKKPIVNVTESNGVIAPAQGTINAGFVDVVDSNDKITATDVEGALEELADRITANAVSSDDKTVVVTPDGNGDTDLSVHIDGKTIVAAASGANKGELTANLTVVALNSTEVAAQGTNVKEAYKLIYGGDTNRTAIGEVIKIYKDSALVNVFIGHVDDKLRDEDSTTHESPTDVVTNGTGDAALVYIMQLADGNYKLAAVNVESFLEESEFGYGLQVLNHVVSVLKDANSGKVRIADTPTGVTPGSAEDTGLVDVITVGTNGVKIDNIQAAIDYATTDLAVSAEGDNYITAAVDANNNKKINVTADVQDLTASAGTRGTYTVTDAGAVSLADEVAPSISGTADSLVDGSDVATKVKTYVDAKVAAEAAARDAYIEGAVKSLDSSVSATAEANNQYSVLTGVTEVDGKLTSKTEVLLAAVAKTGAAADVAITDSGTYFEATNVEGALAELAAFDCGTY